MEAIADLVGILVVMSTTSVFVVLALRNMAQDRPKVWRSAAQDTADLVARWAVWIAVALTSMYGLWSVLDRWGLAGIGLVLGTPLLLSVAAAVMLGWRRWTRSPGRPPRRSTVYLRSSPK